MSMILLKTKKARKDHMCDGPCKIKRIHTGSTYFMLKRQSFYGGMWKVEKYHTICLPDLPTWVQRAVEYQQRRRNTKRMTKNPCTRV
jgi:hypothetical protein